MAKGKLKYVEITDPDHIWRYLEEGKDLIWVDLNNLSSAGWVSTMKVHELSYYIRLLKNENQDNSKHFFLEVVEDE